MYSAVVDLGFTAVSAIPAPTGRHPAIRRSRTREGDPPARIDNEGRTLADAGHGRPFPQNAEPFCHRGVGIEVGAQRDADQADVILAPRNVAGDRIYADVQNLGIQGGELFAAGIEFGYLDGSGGSPFDF